jgi:hypothetical protein
MMSQSELLRSNEITPFFLQVHNVALPFTSHCKQWTYAEPKPLFLSQTGIF